MTRSQILGDILFTRLGVRLWMIFLSFLGAVFGLIAPLCQREFLNQLTGQAQTHSAEISAFQPFHNLNAWGALGLTIISLTLSMILAQAVLYIGARESFLSQRKLAQKLYDKTLALLPESLRGKSTGEIVSVYTTDIPGCTILLEQSIPQGLSILFPLLLAPWILIVEFSIPIPELIISLSLILLFNFWLAYRQSRFFYLFKKLAADRIAVVNEWIQNIRTLRVLGWVQSFEAKIQQLRKVETQNRISMLTNGQSMNAVSSSVSYVLNVAIVAFLVRKNPELVNPSSLLTILWIVAVFLTRPFRQLPWFFTFLFDAWTSIRRYHSILSLENALPERKLDGPMIAPPKQKTPHLRVQGLNLRIGDVQILKNVNLDVLRGEFFAIVGPVGAGKTSLLLSLLKETSAEIAEYEIEGENRDGEARSTVSNTFAFSPQDSFIMSASLAENVLLDYQIDKKLETQPVLASLRSADFDPNSEGLVDGLQTEIGERGVNLSGGQRQRVNIARVDYFDRPVVLLDDCLSAVDVRTENHLMNELIMGRWKNKTRILVTHRLSVLRKADRILFLEHGEVRGVGTFDELYSQLPSFQDFTSTVSEVAK